MSRFSSAYVDLLMQIPQSILISNSLNDPYSMLHLASGMNCTNSYLNSTNYKFLHPYCRSPHITFLEPIYLSLLMLSVKTRVPPFQETLPPNHSVCNLPVSVNPTRTPLNSTFSAIKMCVSLTEFVN